MPKPPTEPTECAQWEISYITEIKPQYYYYQYHSSKSGKSSKSGGKSGKGKSGKGKSDKYVMKEVEVKKEVKTCVETMPPKVVTIAPSPSPEESVSNGTKNELRLGSR
jgi:hypothetical protein